jgi:hypothetical protein
MTADGRLDRDTAFGAVSMEPDVELHHAVADLTHVLDMERTRSCPRVHLRPNVTHVPRRNVDVFGAPDDRRSDAVSAHRCRRYRVFVGSSLRTDWPPFRPHPETRTSEYLEGFYAQRGSS